MIKLHRAPDTICVRDADETYGEVTGKRRVVLMLNFLLWRMLWHICGREGTTKPKSPGFEMTDIGYLIPNWELLGLVSNSSDDILASTEKLSQQKTTCCCFPYVMTSLDWQQISCNYITCKYKPNKLLFQRLYFLQIKLQMLLITIIQLHQEF